jgi:hypothetical protein
MALGTIRNSQFSSLVSGNRRLNKFWDYPSIAHVRNYSSSTLERIFRKSDLSCWDRMLLLYGNRIFSGQNSLVKTITESRCKPEMSMIVTIEDWRILFCCRGPLMGSVLRWLHHTWNLFRLFQYAHYFPIDSISFLFCSFCTRYFSWSQLSSID